jgi:hypothetical protein
VIVERYKCVSCGRTLYVAHSILEASLTPKIGEKSPFLGEDPAAALWYTAVSIKIDLCAIMGG